MPNAPETCSCSALRQAARHVTKFYDDALSPVGLGLNQFSILSKLDRFGPATIQALAARLVMDRSTLGHLLRPLQKRGLVTLDVAREDRRSRVIMLTPAGNDLIAAARPLWAKAEHRFQEAFGEAASVDLRATLKAVATAELGPDPL
ncbi:MAG TPA: MarR family winged helix-turn-helix transcriptional regulator [Aliidongia sp.]|nr:MarR family winged helix-turn-helix transcriptional regulator [Aliidongia sp.]